MALSFKELIMYILHMHTLTDTSCIRVGQDSRKKPTPKRAKMQNFICFLMYGFSKISNRSIWINTEVDQHGITIQQATFGDDTSRTSHKVFILQGYRQPEKNILHQLGLLCIHLKFIISYLVRSKSRANLMFIIIMLFYVNIHTLDEGTGISKH